MLNFESCRFVFCFFIFSKLSDFLIVSMVIFITAGRLNQGFQNRELQRLLITIYIATFVTISSLTYSLYMNQKIDPLISFLLSTLIINLAGISAKADWRDWSIMAIVSCFLTVVVFKFILHVKVELFWIPLFVCLMYFTDIAYVKQKKVAALVISSFTGFTTYVSVI